MQEECANRRLRVALIAKRRPPVQAAVASTAFSAGTCLRRRVSRMYNRSFATDPKGRSWPLIRKGLAEFRGRVITPFDTPKLWVASLEGPVARSVECFL